ncbi:DUF72 domain-containing protein [Phenylobacterium sp.]|jgi:uncharacterized protein YecE (DUF72 family)|uniref:DUF72 domain-containing protein n=1 Tax=Phenylobacterium sp. TaxID=1871053 RepID=UPI002E2EB7B4|nr:DUF72 domain-containing protein [Phenylobacterium sp.]HEX3364988.1 DUF72 domain-containing protein [Phenylobacterium sp.]
MSQGRIRVGTSGWSYKSWRGPFYPADMRQKDWLTHYATQFDTAEINATFYRLPSQAAVAAWREATPADFEFSWKASRFITQAKKLRDPEEPLARVFAPMAALGRKRGPTLFQLPPSLHLDLPRLGAFLARLPPGRHTVEFRHPSWYAEPTLTMLADHDIALCVSDHADAPAPWERTASFAYVRCHGPTGRYAGTYPDKTLEHWADHIGCWAGDGDVYAYFDNDIGAAAPGDAMRLRERLGAFAVRPHDRSGTAPVVAGATSAGA